VRFFLKALESSSKKAGTSLPRNADVFVQRPLSLGARPGATSQQESNVVLVLLPSFLPGMILTGLHSGYSCSLPTQFIFTTTVGASALLNVSYNILTVILLKHLVQCIKRKFWVTTNVVLEDDKKVMRISLN
jgi:hypothetical protein